METSDSVRKSPPVGCVLSQVHPVGIVAQCFLRFFLILSHLYFTSQVVSSDRTVKPNCEVTLS